MMAVKYQAPWQASIVALTLNLGTQPFLAQVSAVFFAASSSKNDRQLWPCRSNTLSVIVDLLLLQRILLIKQ
jgi:hypothetical protein